MARGLQHLRGLLLCACFAVGHSYPGIAGSCNGVFSGDHLPNEVSNLQGGYTIQMRMQGIFATQRSADVTIQHGAESYMGFLVKSFDIETGAPLGKWSNLPPKTQLFEGCVDKDTAVSFHEGFKATKSSPLNMTLSWPADKEIGIVAWLVAEETRWYEVTASSNGGAIGSIPIACPKTRVVPAAIIISFAPIAIIMIVALLTKISPPMDNFLNQRVPLGSTKLPEQYYSNKYDQWFLIRLVTFDIFPAVIESTWGEILSNIVFYVCQIASLVIVVARINEQAKGQTDGYPGDEVELPNPFDAVIGRAIGRVLQYNFGMTILFPMRYSVWPALVGISFERCIKYHRMVARWTYFLMVLHLLLLLGIYGWYDVMTTRESCFGLGNLWGTLSFFGITTVMVTSLEPVRRLQWELFYYSHWLAVAALVGACFHITDTWYYFLPGGALMTIDMLLRFAAWLSTSQVRSATVFDGDVVKLEIECPSFFKAIAAKGALGVGDYCHMQCSDVNLNPLDLHPFSISGLLHGEGPKPVEISATSTAVFSISNGAPEGEGKQEVEMKEISLPSPGASGIQGLTFHIKSMGPNTWSDRLCQAVREKGDKIRVRLEGPYGHMGIRLANYHTVVCVAGGIGFTPMGPLLEMALNPDQRRKHLPNLRRVHVVWAVQKSTHLDWFAELLGRVKGSAVYASVNKDDVQELSNSSAKNSEEVSFHLHLYVTRGNTQHPTLPSKSGRPDMTGLLQSIKADAGEKSVGVVCCGPRPLVADAMSAGRQFGCHCHTETFLL